MSGPQVTVVVPFRNRTLLLAQFVASLDVALAAVETPDDVEIILVDDRSDGPAPKFESSPIKVISSTGAGPSAARNEGARAARSDWLLFTDSDCVVEQAWLETALRLVAADDGAVVQGDPTRYTHETEWGVLEERLYSHMFERYVSEDRSRTAMLDSRNLLIRRNTLLEVGGFGTHRTEALAESRELALRLDERGCPFRFAVDLQVRHAAATSLEQEMRTKRRHGRGRVDVWPSEPTVGELADRYFLAPVAAGIEAAYVVPVHLAFLSGYSTQANGDRLGLARRLVTVLDQLGIDAHVLSRHLMLLEALD